MTSPFAHRWTPEEIAVLGTMNDTDAANRIGVSRAAVKIRRNLLRIPPYNPILTPLRIDRINAVVVHVARGAHSLIDPEDWPLACQHKWSIGSGRYACAAHKVNGKMVRLKLHRIIMSGGPHVDHANGNPLDNRRANLRHATHSQNMANRSKSSLAKSRFKGVAWAAHAGMWRAVVVVNRKGVYTEYFKNEEDAARGYDNAARKHHGEFARTNF